VIQIAPSVNKVPYLFLFCICGSVILLKNPCFTLSVTCYTFLFYTRVLLILVIIFLTYNLIHNFFSFNMRNLQIGSYVPYLKHCCPLKITLKKKLTLDYIWRKFINIKFCDFCPRILSKSMRIEIHLTV
jgi:hypothetical protein